MTTDPETSLPQTGHDGPYDAPVRVTGMRVLPDWIDYNGHMNVAYYTVATDAALDRMLEDHLGLGETFVAATRMGPYALQANYSYLAEMHEGDGFSVLIRLLDHDAKRMHLVLEMIRDGDGSLAARVETLLMNVDLEARRSAAYPEWGQARMTEMVRCHAALPAPDGIGQPIGIRKR